MGERWTNGTDVLDFHRGRLGCRAGEGRIIGTIEEMVYLGDVPVATLRPNGSGGITIYYAHPDYLNTIRKITRSSDNALVWRAGSAFQPFYNSTPDQDPSGLGTFVSNLAFPGQYLDQETGLLYNGARYYSASLGSYFQSDPLGLAGGSYSTYAYAAGNPLKYVDPLGLDIAVVVGGQRTDSYNIAGHVADAVTGGGVYSFGTGTPLGSSFTDYLTLQSEFRNQVVYDIKTTPGQDAAALAYLRSQKDDIGKLDNCAFRTYQSLRNAHVPIREPVAPTPAALQHVLDLLVQQGLATVTYVPINGQIPDLGGFNTR